MTIGLSRCNPWNLETRHIPWRGLLPDQPASGPLAFDSMQDGIRAGVKLCYTYQERGLNTPQKFVEAFSPASAGNPTAQYIANVCEWSGFLPDEALDFRDTGTLIAFARAVWRQEQGAEAMKAANITDAEILAAIALAEET